MKFFKLGVLMAACWTMGCSGGDSGSSADVCPLITGNIYFSVELRDCGAGVAPCNWSVTFNGDGSYLWRFEDQSRQGTFSCDGSRLVANGTSIGSYDSATGVLVWNSVQYQ